MQPLSGILNYIKNVFFKNYIYLTSYNIKNKNTSSNGLTGQKMKKCLVRENRRLTFGGSESAHFLKLLIMYSLSGPSACKRVMSERSQHRWLAEARRMACGEGQLPGSTDQRVVRRELACYPYIKKGTEGQQPSTHRLWGTRQHAGLQEESYLAYR